MPHLHSISVACIVAFCAGSLAAQTVTDPAPAAIPSEVAAPEVFAAENAILDTSIPFAIGAREAQQDLRSAFGWPTFQEGLVEGVYFRLDPDGYARFSPTPRLDSDVFEVICRPRTTACMGRKDRLSVYLGMTGLIEITLEDVAPGDTFHITDGLTETPVPERILMPLDAPLETLLAYGGELVVRRGAEETARISLKGFGPVTTYLRWIAARQDYAVLPRNWPVPGQAPETAEADAGYQRQPAAAVLVSPSAATAPLPDMTAAPVLDAPATFVMSEVHYQDIIARLQRLEQHLVAPPVAPSPVATAIPAPTAPAAVPAPSTQALGLTQLTYLTSVLGFDLETATLIMRIQGDQEFQSLRGSALVDDILTAQPAVPPSQVPLSVAETATAAAPPVDFVALSEYLKTVMPPAP